MKDFKHAYEESLDLESKVGVLFEMISEILDRSRDISIIADLMPSPCFECSHSNQEHAAWQQGYSVGSENRSAENPYPQGKEAEAWDKGEKAGAEFFESRMFMEENHRT